MEAGSAAPRPLTRRPRRGAHPENVGAWLLGFAPVVYLALEGGGYDLVTRSEIGVALWWIVLLGALAGALPRARLSAGAWTAVALFGGYLAWTWIAVGWSGSAERTLAEAARVATYLGFFVLGLCVIDRSTLRHLINGLACAIGLVAGLAVLSRLHPAWFPSNNPTGLYATARLAYPLNYSDATGEFAALGLPLLLYLATGARTLAGRACAAAALPLVVLCVGLTVSRGGILASVVGVLVFFCVVPDRLPRLATAVAAGAGSTVVMYAVLRRPLVRDANVSSGAALASQQHAVLAILLVACAGVALVQAGITLGVRHGARPAWLVPSRRGARIAVGAALVAVVAAVAVGIAGGVDHRLWLQFKQPNPPVAGNPYSRLLSISGSHRYQYWVAATHAFETNPWKGIGPGTFEFYWAAHNSLGEFVVNAHSLYFETLAELGIVGLALVGGLVLFVIAAGWLRASRATPTTRAQIAASVAGFAGFAAAASFDWVWQIAVIPLIALLLAAGALLNLGDGVRIHDARRLVLTRIVLALGALPALFAIVIPLAMTLQVQASQAANRAGNYHAALSDAVSAQRLEPQAASPRLQRALVLEQLGDIAGAAQAITEAAAREPANWRIWLVASRIATEGDRPRVALADYERARMLNPTSPIFSGG